MITLSHAKRPWRCRIRMEDNRDFKLIVKGWGIIDEKKNKPATMVPAKVIECKHCGRQIEKPLEASEIETL